MGVNTATTNADLGMKTIVEDEQFLVRYNGLDGIVNDLENNTCQKFSVYGNGQVVAYENPFILPRHLLMSIQKEVL